MVRVFVEPDHLHTCSCHQSHNSDSQSALQGFFTFVAHPALLHRCTRENIHTCTQINLPKQMWHCACCGVGNISKAALENEDPSVSLPILCTYLLSLCYQCILSLMLCFVRACGCVSILVSHITSSCSCEPHYRRLTLSSTTTPSSE